MQKYKRIGQVGEGTYGRVYKYQIENEFVAVKKIKFEPDKEGLSITAIRELKKLTQLNHVNILSLIECLCESGMYFKINLFLLSRFHFYDL